MNYHAKKIEERNGCTIITLERVNLPQRRKRTANSIRIWSVIAAVGVLSAALGFTLAREKNPPEAREPNATAQVITLHNLVDAHSEKKPEIVHTVERVYYEAEEIDEPAVPTSIGWFTITAYCACEKCCGKTPDDPWYGITATGTRAAEGRTVAVDPRVIPLGGTVYFEGPDGLIGGYIAEDTGGAIKGNRIDLYFESHEAALEWGVRTLEVFVMPGEVA